jgi:hypothetical protein
MNSELEKIVLCYLVNKNLPDAADLESELTRKLSTQQKTEKIIKGVNRTFKVINVTGKNIVNIFLEDNEGNRWTVSINLLYKAK